LSTQKSIPLIDFSNFLKSSDLKVAQEIGKACAEYGFFTLTHHGVDETLQSELENLSQQFFGQNLEEKMKISMKLGGRAWRGYFPVGEELTSGQADHKEGVYFGEEIGDQDPRVQQGLPLHGKNLFPQFPAGFKDVVLKYELAMTNLAHELMRAISMSLDLAPNYFHQHFTEDPLILFRIFHYPATSSEKEDQYPWGVGEHTDYGLLTLLKQDDKGGLEAKIKEDWISVPPVPNSFVCNVGDMLDYLTQGKYRSLPHRVKNISGKSRYSFPFFFDPNFKAKIQALNGSFENTVMAHNRWDHADLYQFKGTYGDYLLKKVSKVFPVLAQSKLK